MNVTGREQDNFVAFRSSCDRCRYMKLKCPSNGNEAHDPCDRCAKAKLRCTYSRRTNLRRRTITGQDHSSDGQANHNEQTTVPTESDQLGGSPNPTAIQAAEIPCESVDTFGYTNPLDTGPDELLWVDWEAPSTSATSSSLWADSSPTTSEYRASLTAQCTLGLINMAVELGECLQTLRGDIRTQQSIDDYPIGQIRHLSQAFVASAQNRSNTISTDHSMGLLLLSCYVSLRKLYLKAFSNIKDSLRVINQPQQQLPNDDRSKRLCGMDMFSERWMRNYTAFNITLDLLHGTDAALDLCILHRPLGQMNPPDTLIAGVAQPTTDHLGIGLEKTPSSGTCTACALPLSFRKEAASTLSDISDQEHALQDTIGLLKGMLRQRMGLL